MGIKAEGILSHYSISLINPGIEIMKKFSLDNSNRLTNRQVYLHFIKQLCKILPVNVRALNESQAKE